MQIILASTSPRRKDVLTKLGLDFTVVASDFEEYFDQNRTAAEIAEELAYGKAKNVSKRYPDALVIGGDTIVVDGEEQLGKYPDYDEAFRLLKHLSGRTHTIVSGLVVLCKAKNIHYVTHEVSVVRFKDNSDETIKSYLDLGTYTDKAGAYGLESGGDILVEYMKGSFTNIIGLSTEKLVPFLTELGIKTLDVDFPATVPVLA